MLTNSLAPPPISNVPDNLQIRPLTPNSNTNSTTTTPGLTPMGESTCLLSGSGGGVAIDHVAGAPNSVHFRQHSRDSGSTTTTTTTTPTEGDRLLPSSASLTVSTTGQTSSTCMTGLTGGNSSSRVPLPTLSRANTEISTHYNGHLGSGNYPPTSRTMSEMDSNIGEMHDNSEGPVNVPSRWSGGTRAKSTDPIHHVYSTVGETFKTMKVEYHTVSQTLTTGAGLSGEHQSLTQLYHQGHQVYRCTDCSHLFLLCPVFPCRE